MKSKNLGREGIALITREQTCCFTGHRPAKLPWGYDETDPRCQSLKRRIRDALECAWQEGYRHFLCGMAMGCDIYFCEEALALRAQHPEVTVEAAIPCPTQADAWPPAQRRRYHRLVEDCDLETMVADKYSASCMIRRDRYMVDRSSLLIAAFDGTPGGTQYTVQYAMSKGVNVVDLAIEVPEDLSQSIYPAFQE